MPLPRVSGAQIRGRTYHLNLPIPKVIQALYPDSKTGVMRRSLKTSDPREAERQVREQRTIFDRQVKEAEREAAQNRILSALGKEDRDLLAEVGGTDELLATIRELRMWASVTLAGSGANADLAKETDTLSPFAARIQREREERGTAETLTHLTSETRRLRRIAAELGQEVSPAPKGIDEGVTGIRDLAHAFTTANAYTVQNTESVINTIRRWVELHGDIPIEKWERHHLDQFDKILIGLPKSTAKEIRSLPIREAVLRAKRDGLETIKAKTRKRYSDHMKSLSQYALNQAGLIPSDPFAGFKPRRERENISDAGQDDTIPFTPQQVGRILDHAASFDPELIDHWLPLLAAYTGARREELGQLMVGNIRLYGHIYTLEITDRDPLQKLKNKHSLRFVPIPSPVIDAGFLDYVERRRQAGGHMLFLEDHHDKRRRATRREVQPDKRGRLTERFGDRFRRKVRVPLGLTEDGMKFHSLRHSWTDAARATKIDREIRRLIAGRLDDEDPTEAGYGGATLLSDKLEALEQIARYVRA